MVKQGDFALENSKVGGFMKRIVFILAVLMSLVIVGSASAQIKAKSMQFSPFSITVTPYTDMKIATSSDDADPLWRYGLRVDANNVLYGLGFYVSFEGGVVDTRSTEVKQTCNNPNGCIWPQSFIDSVENGQHYTGIRFGTQIPIEVFGK